MRELSLMCLDDNLKIKMKQYIICFAGFQIFFPTYIRIFMLEKIVLENDFKNHITR